MCANWPRQKFAGVSGPPTEKGVKGKRRRVTLRVNEDVAKDMSALRMALGRTVYELAEEILVKGVAEEVAEFKSTKPDEWDVIRGLSLVWLEDGRSRAHTSCTLLDRAPRHHCVIDWFSKSAHGRGW